MGTLTYSMRASLECLKNAARNGSRLTLMKGSTIGETRINSASFPILLSTARSITLLMIATPVPLQQAFGKR